MKRIILPSLMMALAFQVYADITVKEPEFKNSYVHLTSDSTSRKMPKEMAQFKKHESKGSKWAKIGSAVGSAAGTMGVGVALAGNSVGVAVGGLRTMGAGMGVAAAAQTLDILAGFEGLDIVFDGKESTYRVPAGTDVRIIYRAESNETDPMDFFRVVEFKQGKKDRRIQWKNISTSLLETGEQRKNGYLPFDATKFGETSYLITIPAEVLKEGEYGIVSPVLESATVLPVVTFSVAN